jgi:predicted ATPase/DNA-binding XRE family transcriptional regulator
MTGKVGRGEGKGPLRGRRKGSGGTSGLGAARRAEDAGAAAFGSLLKQHRRDAWLTQEELAERSGLSVRTIRSLERGEGHRPRADTVDLLAHALGLSEEEHDLFAAVPKRGDVAASTLVATPESILPEPPTPLLGRERALEEVAGFLSRPETRLLTLTGTGGVGKTRLALEAAREAADLFPDGIVFVALAPLSDPALVVPTVAQALGLRESKGQTPREVLRVHLQEKRLLLLLDNFEHVLEVAPEVAGLIDSCPDLTVLATSRAPLRVRGEQEYPVSPLKLPSSTLSPSPEDVVGSPSGRLFVERARAASPAFELTRENAGAAAAICWRLAGLPLALELAAVRVRFLNPAALLSRLDQALSAGWARDLPERQRTMTATLGWSYDLLSEYEKALFRRLSVFVGGFTLEAAEAIFSGGGAVTENLLYLLGELVEQSLITANMGANGNEGRYGMLEPVRLYTKEKLEESEEVEEIRGRHAAYFLDLADHAGQELTRAEQAAWLDRLDREHDNLRATLSWLLEQNDADGGARLGWDLKWFWYVRGHLAEGRRWMERTLAREGALSPGGRAKALIVAAALASAQDDYEGHAALANEGLRQARQAGNREVLAMATYLAGHAAFGSGEHVRAATLSDESVALYHALGDRSGAGLAITVPAYVALAEADFAHAEQLLDESEKLLRAAGSWWHLTANLTIRATVTAMRGDHTRTVVLLRESLAIAPRLRDTQAVVYGLEGMAGALAMLGEGHRAARLFGAVDALRERTGSAITLSPWRELRERHLEALRTRLGAEELAAERAEGQAMTPEQAVAYAIGGDEGPPA